KSPEISLATSRTVFVGTRRRQFSRSWAAASSSKCRRGGADRSREGVHPTGQKHCPGGEFSFVCCAASVPALVLTLDAGGHSHIPRSFLAAPFSAQKPTKRFPGPAFRPAVAGPRLRSNRAFGASLARACCEMSRRDGAIVAWHEVPGTAPPQRAVP